MVVILVFLNEEIGNIGVAREMENLDFLVLLSITRAILLMLMWHIHSLAKL